MYGCMQKDLVRAGGFTFRVGGILYPARESLGCKVRRILSKTCKSRGSPTRIWGLGARGFNYVRIQGSRFTEVGGFKCFSD